ncbi:RPII140-upstream protein [Biomphalaria glabrata]
MFSKLYAAEEVDKPDETVPVNNVTIPTLVLERIAREYIEKESGMDRINMLFSKNHKGEESEQLRMLKFTIIQIFCVSFFMKYVPEWKLAKDDFIRENRATVFRTRIQAMRLMQDQVSLRACKAGAIFSVKVTSFSAFLLMISQLIAVYRNKTSVIEYTVAAGITGGFYRINMGLKGLVSGTIIGASLGSIAGCFAWVVFSAFNKTQDQLHLQEIISKIEVERYLTGEEAFKNKVEIVRKTLLTTSVPQT